MSGDGATGAAKDEVTLLIRSNKKPLNNGTLAPLLMKNLSNFLDLIERFFHSLEIL
jgi:hypothetical protein